MSVGSLLLGLVFVAGCKIYRQVPLDAIDAEIELGDRVRVVETDGSKAAFEVTSVDDEALGGTGVRIPRSEIRSIEVERIAPWRSLFAGLGLAYVFLIVVGALTVVLLYAFTV